MAERQYSSFEELRKQCAEDAMNRYLDLKSGLREYDQPLLLRGKVLPGELTGKGRQLVERLLNVTVATGDFSEVVGFKAYRAKPSDGQWEAGVYAAMTPKMEEGPFNSAVFDSKETCWMACDLWCEQDRWTGKGTSRKMIQGNPFSCARLTEDDFKSQELTCLNYERQRQPALYELTYELGVDAVLEPDDERLKLAMVKDGILMTGKWPDPLPKKYQHLVEELSKLFKRSQLPNWPKVRLRLDVYAHLAKCWYTEGYCFMLQKELTGFINARFGTHFRVGTLARQCQRMGLPSKRLRPPPKMILSGEDLEKCMEDLEHQSPDWSTASAF